MTPGGLQPSEPVWTRDDARLYLRQLADAFDNALRPPVDESRPSLYDPPVLLGDRAARIISAKLRAVSTMFADDASASDPASLPLPPAGNGV